MIRRIWRAAPTRVLARSQTTASGSGPSQPIVSGSVPSAAVGPNEGPSTTIQSMLQQQMIFQQQVMLQLQTKRSVFTLENGAALVAIIMLGYSAFSTNALEKKLDTTVMDITAKLDKTDGKLDQTRADINTDIKAARDLITAVNSRTDELIASNNSRTDEFNSRTDELIASNNARTDELIASINARTDGLQSELLKQRQGWFRW